MAQRSVWDAEEAGWSDWDPTPLSRSPVSTRSGSSEPCLIECYSLAHYRPVVLNAWTGLSVHSLRTRTRYLDLYAPQQAPFYIHYDGRMIRVATARDIEILQDLEQASQVCFRRFVVAELELLSSLSAAESASATH